MELDEFSEWRAAALRIAGDARRLIVVGGTDTGKTTFCTLVANEALAKGRRVAVLDCDLGQAEIGPPACVGLGLPTERIGSLGDVRPASLAFLGLTSPR